MFGVVMPPERKTLLQRAAHSVGITLRFWMQTEVHVYAFSVAANVLLSFFPFLIVSVSLSRLFFDRQTTVATLDLALHDYFPDALGRFMRNNLPQGQPVNVVSIFLLFFTANGVFEPMEVALNRIWGITKNRSWIANQAISLALIFVCGGLALLSLAATALQIGATRDWAISQMVTSVFYKIAAVPLTSLSLFLVYRYLPNGRPPLHRVIPAAIVVGLLLELLKYFNLLFWPWFDQKIQREYGVFRYSVTIIMLGFISTLLVLAGAEWSARGHRFSPTPKDAT